MKISFCLITLNEEENLPRCLKSFEGLADEIVVVDSGSKDRTREIAEGAGARFIHQEWLGYRDQKNRVLSEATQDWVFSIDADEALPPELRKEIETIKESEPDEKLSGYSMPRCVLYEGRWIRHGDWYPDRLDRLVRKSRSRFTGGQVHEKLEVEGMIIPLKGELEHHSFKNEKDHRNRCMKYACLWAQMKQEAGKKAGPLSPWTHACFRWIRNYIIKLGFLDGAQGWKIARFCAREVFLKYQLLRELNQEGSKN